MPEDGVSTDEDDKTAALKPLCERFREKKVALEALKEQVDNLANAIKRAAANRGIRGSVHGVTISVRRTFDREANLKLAQQKDLVIPMKEEVDWRRLEEAMALRMIDPVYAEATTVALTRSRSSSTKSKKPPESASSDEE